MCNLNHCKNIVKFICSHRTNKIFLVRLTYFFLVKVGTDWHWSKPKEWFLYLILHFSYVDNPTETGRPCTKNWRTCQLPSTRFTTVKNQRWHRKSILPLKISFGASYPSKFQCLPPPKIGLPIFGAKTTSQNVCFSILTY